MLYHRIFIKKIFSKVKKILAKLMFFTPTNFVWQKKFNYKKNPKIIDIAWQKIYTTGVITVPIDIIHTRIRTLEGLQIIPLGDTPHYQWIKNIIKNKNDSVSRTKYYNYSKTFFSEEDPHAQLVAVKKMALSFKERKNIHTVDIVAFPPTLKQESDYCVVLYDGIHRVSIAKALGHKSIKCHLVQEKIYHKDLVKSFKK